MLAVAHLLAGCFQLLPMQRCGCHHFSAQACHLLLQLLHPAQLILRRPQDQRWSHRLGGWAASARRPLGDMQSLLRACCAEPVLSKSHLLSCTRSRRVELSSLLLLAVSLSAAQTSCCTDTHFISTLVPVLILALLPESCVACLWGSC